MEQRWNLRAPVETSVELHVSGRPPLQGISSNVSLEGMFVRTDPLQVPTNTFVQIRLGGDRRTTTVPAVVVRCEHDGVGLMFPNRDDALQAVLNELLDNHFALREPSDA